MHQHWHLASGIWHIMMIAKLQRPKTVKEAERKREGAGHISPLALMSLLHMRSSSWATQRIEVYHIFCRYS